LAEKVLFWISTLPEEQLVMHLKATLERQRGQVLWESHNEMAGPY